MNIQKIYEELISDISYTNKDFRTIYPELIDIFKKFTNKWDPSVSNESDVGVMLIKLIALATDKNNFNLDKAALENFPVSVTQLGNAQQLYDSLGYRMGWFRSATLDVGFRLTSTENAPVELDILDTQISDSSGSVIYTLLEKVKLTNLNEEKYVTCMEGVPYLYEINGSNLITMNNLDSNLRLYFDDTQISENGIFIWDSSTIANKSIEETWKRVDNLASQPAKSKVFSFGILPNSNKSYIQFSDDVATLLGSGLTIYYIIGSGTEGNIKANVLDSWNQDLSSESAETSVNKDIQIIQTKSSTNGRDPETIEEAYKNYKKNIGTFDTLVTKRDYDNYIYNQEDQFRNPLISNVIVSDRTSDINNSYKITTWEPGLERQLNVVKTHKTTLNLDGGGTATIDEPNLTPYDIVLYLLKKPENVINKTSYNNTFKPEDDASLLLDIEARLEDSKSVNHNIYLPHLDQDITYNPVLDDKFTYNNLLTLKGTLITYNKVTKVEAKEIEAKVMEALFTKYNGREVIIGSEIDYENLVKTIEGADERIKYLVLNDNYYETVLTKYSTGEQTALSTADKNEIIAKMVLAGNTQLFKFKDDFLYEFGQTNINQRGTIGNAIKSATTWAEITIPTSGSYEIKDNELIQVYHDNLITTKEYGFYVKYNAVLLNTIEANENRVLDAGETITLTYTTSGQEITEILNPGTLIQPSIKIENGDDKRLQTGQSIKVKGKNEFTLADNMPYYFILNNVENKLKLDTDNNHTYILQENEYFLYSSPTSTDLIVLGSGTKLTTEVDFEVTCEIVDLDKLTAGNTVAWNKIPAGNNNPKLKTTELYIQTLSKGIEVYFDSGTAKTLSDSGNENKAIELDNTDKFNYREAGSVDWEELEVLPVGIKWNIHSRLNLYASNIVPQTLQDNQYVKLTFEDNTDTGNNITDCEILFNNNVIIAGGTDIDMRVLNDVNEYEYSLLALTYKLDTNFDLKRNTSEYYSLIGGNPISYELPFEFEAVTTMEESWLIPVYVNKANGASTVDIYTSTNGTTFNIPLNLFNTKNPNNSNNPYTSEDLKTGAYILQLPLSAVYKGIKVDFTNGTENDSVVIGYINKLNGFNEDEITDDEYDLNTNKNNVVDKIIELNKNDKFNWLKVVDESNKVLKPVSPGAFWGINHVANSFTLPQLNLLTTTLRVNKSSIN